MKRRYYVSVLDTFDRKIIITGDNLPIEAVISASEYVSFDVQSNRHIQERDILFEKREEEIYFTLLGGRVPNMKGVIKSIIPYNHDIFICHGKYTCRYEAMKKELKVIYWNENKKEEKSYSNRGKLQRIHVGNRIKASFESGNIVIE